MKCQSCLSTTKEVVGYGAFQHFICNLCKIHYTLENDIINSFSIDLDGYYIRVRIYSSKSRLLILKNEKFIYEMWSALTNVNDAISYAKKIINLKGFL